MNRALGLIALIGLLPAAAESQDAKQWAEALAYYQRNSASREPIERRQSAEALGDATTEKHDKLCWQLVSALLRAELAREGSGRSEEKVSGEVVEGCLRAFRKITHKDILAEMAKVAKNKAENPRVRAYAIWGIHDKGDLKEFAELLDDRSPIVQIAAMDCLADRADLSSIPVFLRVLSENRTWEVKWTALKGLEKGADDKSVEPLIELLAKCRPEEGRLRDQYIRVLRKLLDSEMESDDPNAWKSAWIAKKDGSEMKPGATLVEPTSFYGLKSRSTRLVFVLDRTGSMEAPIGEPDRSIFKLPDLGLMGGEKEPPQEKAAREECLKFVKKWKGTVAKTRIDVAKKEIIGTIFHLRPSVYFNVIWYESTPSPWKQELVPATWVHKLDAIQQSDKITAAGNTNIWDALETAYKLLEVAPSKLPLAPVVLDKKANYATSTGGIDTIYLMSDGKPRNGRIDAPDDLLAELRKVNRIRKVTIHSICIGDIPPGGATPDSPDAIFMKKISDQNNGDFVHIQK